MADHFALTTSPLKNTKKAAGSRKEMSARDVKDEYATPYANFSRDHLNAPPDPNLHELLEADPTLVTLTEFDKFCGNNEPIVFVDHHSAYLKHHPNGYFDCSPDVASVLKSRFLTYPSTTPCKTPSIQHFLMAMYDILEAHRWAVKKRNVIHRDISIGNILINPKDELKADLDESGRPIFINEVLTKEEHALPVARLYDFDNGAENDRNLAQTPSFKQSLERSPDYEHLRHRTGTPRYMARAVAAGRTLERDLAPFRRMPSLSSRVLLRYKRVHQDAGADPFRPFEDRKGTVHGVCLRDLNRDTDSDQDDSDKSDDNKSDTDKSDSDEFVVNKVQFTSAESDNVEPDTGESSDEESSETGSDGGQSGKAKSTPQAPIFQHLPRHDAESVFWKEPPALRASTEISLDGQHLQRAGHRSHISVSQGSDGIVKDKRKRRDSIEASSSDSLSPPLPARSRLPDIPTFIAGALDVFPPGVTREEWLFRDKRRRL
ncbi:hypothetical protein AB1N83_002342 [Pleurotus pulmonarius]